MTNLRRRNTKRVIQALVVALFAITWLLLCANNINLLSKINRDESGFGPIDVVRRVTSPDWSKTAILVRSYASLMDLNFALYITDDEFADVTRSNEDASFVTDSDLPDSALWIQRALWISLDYEPTTHKNWREDVVWSEDGTVITVTIEEQYVFAYDFQTKRRYEDPAQIRSLLE
ncbi:MAG: hypothetical protein GY832_41240 [Chloroflexi bacterium]|nr:hypothetical protein [Chloroflexota bacterium]